MNVKEIKHKVKKKREKILEITQHYFNITHQHDYLNTAIELNSYAL